MPLPYRILAAAAVGLLALPAARAELHLEALVNGQRLPVGGVEHHLIYAEAGHRRIPLPPDAAFVLEGDLRANSSEAFWSPTYGVSRVDLPDRERAHTTTPYAATFWFNHDPARRSKQPDSFTRAWPAGTRSPSILVFAWVVDGRPTQAWAHAVGATTSGRGVYAEHGFHLTADGARGELIALLWTDGHFVAPAPHFPDPAGEAAFHAVELDDVAGLRAALAAGLKPDARDSQGVTLLQYAAEAGALPCVDALLAAGADVNAHGAHGTPLSWAAADGRAAVVQRLLAAKAHPDADGISALQEAISGGHEDIALALINAGAYRDAKNHLRQTPAGAALDAGMARAVALLLHNGAELDFSNDQMPGVLATQAKLGHAAAVQLLLAHHVRQDHATALIEGAVSGDPVIAKALIAHGARPDEPGPNGITALMVTASHDRAQYAEALLAAGAHPNVATATGATALHLAATDNAAKVTRVLLQHGADLNLRVGHSTALDLALAVDARETAAVLADAGARIDLHSPAAAEELQRAIEYDLAPLVSAAIADGWSPNTQFAGWPALDLARVYRARGCVAVLERAGARLGSAAPKLGNRKELDHGVRPAQLFRPEDPRTKRDDFPEGHVEVEALVDRDGTPRFVRLVKADDFSLVRPAIEAVSQWRFQPAVEHGKPVPVLVEIPLLFPSSDELWPNAEDLDVLPRVTHQQPPEYPVDLRRNGTTGTVLLRFLVNTAGQTERIHVLSSSHPELSQAAVAAVSHWTFKPGLLDGRPVASWQMVPIVFTLNAE